MTRAPLPIPFKQFMQSIQSVAGTPFGIATATPVPRELRDLATLGDHLHRLCTLVRTRADAAYSAGKDVGEVYADVRALKEFMALLADQPGYKAADPAAAARRAAGAPLKQQIDAIGAKLESSCPRNSAASVFAPDVVRDHRATITEIAEIINGAEVELAAKDEPSRKAKSTDVLDAALRCQVTNLHLKVFLVEHFANILQACTQEALQSEYGEKLAESIEVALEDHRKARRNLIAGCIATSASLVGNLPGPDSVYIAFLRLRAVWGVSRAMNRANLRDAEAMKLRDMLIRGLRFDAKDSSEAAVKGPEGGQTSLKVLRAKFDLHMCELERLRLLIRDAQKATGNSNDNLAKIRDLNEQFKARAKVLNKEVIEERTGRFQTTPVYNWVITVMNVYTIFAKAESAPDLDNDSALKAAAQWFVYNGGMVNAAAAAYASGTAGGTRWYVATKNTKTTLAAMERWATTVGDKFITPFTGALSFVDGWVQLDDWRTTGDPWKLVVGGLEVGSGFLLIVAVICSTPGCQPAGAVLGFLAGAVQVIQMAVDASKDPLRETVFKVIDDLLARQRTWDKGPFAAKHLGIDADLRKLRADFDASGLGVLEVDRRATGSDYRAALDTMLARFQSIGFEPSTASRMIVASGGVSDFIAREQSRR